MNSEGKSKASIIVVGSINMDITVRVVALAALGETVLGGDAELLLGGKGANQAIAAHRLGADVKFIARVGDDAFGLAALDSLKLYGVDLASVYQSSGVATGVAMIAVDQNGQNAITLSPGANARLAVADLHDSLNAFSKHQILLLQNEVSPDVSCHAATMIRANGGIVIVDPAPAQNFDQRLIGMADIITPNETEATALTGVSISGLADARLAADLLIKAGAGAVLLKMGGAGVIYAGRYGEGHVPAHAVVAVDTVAAGDCFNGALAVALGEGSSFHEAVEFACKAAALSVTRKGAAASMPSRAEVNAMI